MEFRRFVSYMYAYRQDEKRENCGFIKVEVRQNMARFRVHVYMPGRKDMEYRVYGFVRKEEQSEGVLLGMGKVRNGNLDVQIHGNAEGLGIENRPEYEKVSIERFAGILIRGAEETVYGTVWDDGELVPSRFCEWSSKEQPKEQSAEAAQSPKEQSEEVAQSLQEQPKEQGVEAVKAVEAVELHIQEVGTESVDWESLKKCCPHVRPFEDMEAEQGEYLRIQPKELKYFTRELWHLGRNSFLLHGYYNYRYLIVGKKQGGYVLGIPGNYYPREESLSTMFGFPAFLPAKPKDNRTGSFGYWCRWIQG